MSTDNKFEELADKEEEDDVKEVPNINGKGNETKQWVEDTFSERKKELEEKETKSNDEGLENPMEKRQIPVESPVMVESQTVDKRGDKDNEADTRSSNKGYDMNQVDQQREEEGNSIIRTGNKMVKETIYLDLQEMTEEEKQQRMDLEEDEDIGENIHHISWEGDISPRKIKTLESGAKRSKSCIPSLSLHVKTRSSKERSEDISE